MQMSARVLDTGRLLHNNDFLTYCNFCILFNSSLHYSTPSLQTTCVVHFTIIHIYLQCDVHMYLGKVIFITLYLGKMKWSPNIKLFPTSKKHIGASLPWIGILKLQTLHLMAGPAVGSARIAPHAGQKSGSTINSCSRLLSSMTGRVQTIARLSWVGYNDGELPPGWYVFLGMWNCAQVPVLSFLVNTA